MIIDNITVESVLTLSGLTSSRPLKLDASGNIVATTIDISASTDVTGVLPIANGGTGQSTAANSLNAILPDQTGNSGKVLGTNGSTASWVSAGTVTTISIVSANGISGSVANATTTPAITLTLGAITPTSVAATGTVTGSNLSGTNTGDQTTITGNAGTATALQTARTINGVSFDGTANITIAAAAGTLTGTTLNATVVNSSLTSVGTISSGTWNGTAIAATNGGTGQTSYTVGDILYASTTSALSKLAGVATGNALISGGVSTAPSWGKIGLTTHISGTLGIANGGTALTTAPTNGQLLIGNGTNYTLATITDGYGHLTTNGSGTITQAVSLTSIETASTTTNTTTSTTYALLTNSISGTPAAGTWLVMFSCSLGNNSTSAASTFISLYKGPSGSTAQVSGTERRLTNGSGGQGSTITGSVSFQTVQTFNGTDIYEIRWRVSGGTASIFSRAITLLRLA